MKRKIESMRGLFVRSFVHSFIHLAAAVVVIVFVVGLSIQFRQIRLPLAAKTKLTFGSCGVNIQIHTHILCLFQIFFLLSVFWLMFRQSWMRSDGEVVVASENKICVCAKWNRIEQKRGEEDSDTTQNSTAHIEKSATAPVRFYVC